MHSMRFDSPGGAETWHAHMCSDLSGEVRFVYRDTEMEVPGEFLKEIVARWVMREKISVLEQQEAEVILLGGCRRGAAL